MTGHGLCTNAPEARAGGAKSVGPRLETECVMSTAFPRTTQLRNLLIATLALTSTWACQSQDAAAPPSQAAQPVAAAQPAAPSGPTRMESDLLGEKAVPADAYYGVQ